MPSDETIAELKEQIANLQSEIKDLRRDAKNGDKLLAVLLSVTAQNLDFTVTPSIDDKAPESSKEWLEELMTFFPESPTAS